MARGVAAALGVFEADLGVLAADLGVLAADLGVTLKRADTRRLDGRPTEYTLWIELSRAGEADGVIVVTVGVASDISALEIAFSVKRSTSPILSSPNDT